MTDATTSTRSAVTPSSDRVDRRHGEQRRGERRAQPLGRSTESHGVDTADAAHVFDVKVAITGGDRKVGAMVKALAVEVAGYGAATGATKAFLFENGYYMLHFEHEGQAEEFRGAISAYVSKSLAQIVN